MKEFKIMEIDYRIYFILAAVVVGGIALGVLPSGMIGAFAFMFIFGEIMNTIGESTPIVNTFLGGGPIVVIFGSSALTYFNVVPEYVTENVSTFMQGGGFLNFYIAALITGSILGMNRKILIKAAVRYFPCILGGVVVSLIFVAGVGLLFDTTPGEAIAYVGIPIMGGGMGAGAVPISEVFSNALDIPTEQILSRLVPAVVLGNAMSIIAAGLLDRLGKAKPSLTGNGKLMKIDEADDDSSPQKSKGAASVATYGIGVLIACTFYVFGQIVAELMIRLIGLDLHPYAWMIVSVAIVKATDIMPEKYMSACASWYNFVSGNFTSVLLVGIGIVYTDLGQVIDASTLPYMAMCAATVIGSIVGSIIVAKWVGFYAIEAAITAGLCMANMGGTGNIAVLTASKRMELMPFAEISARLGGAFIILLATIMVPILF